MMEYFTEAIVLDKKESGDFDNLIFLYTRDLGKVTAMAKSVRKITSKLAGHLEPLNFVRVRLVEKNGFRIVDALAPKQIKKQKASVESFSKSLALLQFVKAAAFDLQPDPLFWQAVRKILTVDFNEKKAYRYLLKILGFDPKFAACQRGGGKEADYFLKTDQIFFCKQCALKIPKDDVVLV